MGKMLEKSGKGKNDKKKQSEIQLFTSTIQMSQESSRTDPYSPYFGHIKVSHVLTVFYGLNELVVLIIILKKGRPNGRLLVL